MNKKLWIKYTVFGLIAAFLTVLDQWSKIVIVNMAEGVEGRSFVIFKDILNFTYIKNMGASMGIMQGQRVLLIIITFVILGFGGWYFKKHRPDSLLLLSSCSLILSGAIGNLIDRIQFGYVRDFIDVQFINFYTFNVADCGIVIGAAMLIVYAFLNIED